MIGDLLHCTMTWTIVDTPSRRMRRCNFAHSIWSVIQAASGLYTPTSIVNIFGNWLHGIDYKYMILLRVGAMSLIWSLWLCRNDKVFNIVKFGKIINLYQTYFLTLILLFQLLFH
jgi:hypothetical protein